MEKILVSSCLLGERVRYDGADKRSDDRVLLRWVREGRVLALCPEVAGGLPVPRPPAEIALAAGGAAVLSGAARVLAVTGRDVSAHFIAGANAALACARAHSVRVAVLKEGSPSCGTGSTYDGTFASRRVSRPGVAAALLQQAGIRVFSELQLAEAERLIGQLEEAALR